MIAGYTNLVEKLFICYLRDMLRPHKLNKFSIGLHRHTCNNGKVYEHYRNRINKIEAERFFTDRNQDFRMWCDLMEWDSRMILQIVKHCVDNNLDRLQGKHALQAYFEHCNLTEGTDGKTNND